MEGTQLPCLQQCGLHDGSGNKESDGGRGRVDRRGLYGTLVVHGGRDGALEAVSSCRKIFHHVLRYFSRVVVCTGAIEASRLRMAMNSLSYFVLMKYT